MKSNYQKIVRDNLGKLYANLPGDLEARLPAGREGKCYSFEAFGKTCRITPEGVYLGDALQDGVLGILISLYALNAGLAECRAEPMKAFKDFPNSMPYVGAFRTHTEMILLPRVSAIETIREKIADHLHGNGAQAPEAGDFSFTVFPLPKIALGYIFYEADEDFPPAVTCLYSNNADQFLPLDALADVGEYTSKAILNLV